MRFNSSTSPTRGFTHFSQNAAIASAYFGLMLPLSGSETSGPSITSGASSAGVKNFSRSGSTAASAASASAVASLSGMIEASFAGASSHAFIAAFSASEGSTFARSASFPEISESFFSSSGSSANSESRSTPLDSRKSMAASSSGTRTRPSPSVSRNSNVRESKRSPVLDAARAVQYFWSSSLSLLRSSPHSILTCLSPLFVQNFHLQQSSPMFVPPYVV